LVSPLPNPIPLPLWLRSLQMGARWCALLAGGVLCSMVLVTCVSVLGRNVLERTVVGDFEWVGLACGVAVALSLPWCQLQRGHIVVDFFTAKTSANTVEWLDRAGSFLLGVGMAVLAWRCAVGGFNAYSNHASSMLLGLPHWWAYAAMVVGLALTAVLGLAQAVVPKALRNHG
jgi:TRAP-type C4-dicarboxylate transport system permease small subunit